MNEKIEKYLKDPDGAPSSTRMMSFRLQRAFIVFMFMFLPMQLILAFMEADDTLVLVISLCCIIFGIIVLGFVYAPKYLAKKLELNKAIAAIEKIGQNALGRV